VIRLGAQQYAFRNITTDEGLPTSECYHLMQDSKGYIWVSSNAGLGKYNGRTFKTFTTATGLTDNIVFKTFEDEQGRLFYITGNTRIGYLRNDTAYTLPVTDTLSRLMSLGKYFIYEICNYDKEHFLISTQRGFYTLDKKTLSRLVNIPAIRDMSFRLKIMAGKASGAYYDIVAPPKGNTYKLYIEARERSFMVPVIIENPAIYKTCVLSDGTIIVGFSNELFIISHDGSSVIRKTSFPVTAISQDARGGVWISMLNNGLYYYPCKSNEHGAVSGPCLSDPPEHLLEGESPTAVLMDTEGGIWISTLYNGIYYCPNLGIVNYSSIKKLSSKLYGLSCISPVMLTNGLNNTIFVFKDKKNFREIELPAGKNMKGAYSYIKKDNKIYVSGYNTSYILDTAFRRTHILTDSSGSSMFIYKLVENKDQQLIGVRFSELVQLKNDTIYKDVSLPSRGRDIAVDGTGLMYIATNKGLYIREAGHLTAVPGMSLRINRLKCGPDGTMWVCTDGKGLVEMNGAVIKRRYTTGDGLASDICYDVDFDRQENAWIATNKGLCCISGDGLGKIFTCKKQNGLPNNEIFKVAVKDDELYICTQKGLCAANLSDLHPNLLPPRIHLSVLNNGAAIEAKKIFSADQNNFEFDAEGISFQNSTDIVYRYRLGGFDTGWNVSTTGDITYNNLTDGAYTFEVKAVNADGVESTTAAIYSFVIQKPFWKKLWFILLALLAFAGMVYLLFSWRVRVVKRKEMKKNYFNKLMAEYHMSALRAQMNPHFIFNAINSIQHYILSNEKQYAYDYLTKFSILIRQVLANSQNNTTSLNKEIELLELYIELEQRRFKNRFEYEIRYPDEVSLDEVKIPVMLVQPFVENAIWHGIMNMPEETKGKLTVSVELDDETLRISVEDNGIGRKAASLKDVNGHAPVGMLLSQERLEILKVIGNNDTKIVVTDLEDDNGVASGTRVDIYLTII
jgi:hypothetical protein